MKPPNYIMLRIDKKDFINKLKALKDNYVELWITPDNKTTIQIKDRYDVIYHRTKN